VERLHAVVHGDVQGVGFRYHVTRAAHPLDLRGWVRNKPDGTVELVSEGPRSALEQLLESARRGPRGATVTRVDVEWSPALGGLGRFDPDY
jgi:acylphosphatase